jgi:hypothetical protein
MSSAEKGEKGKLVSPRIGHGAPEKTKKGGKHRIGSRSHTDKAGPSGIPENPSEKAEPDKPGMIVVPRRHEEEYRRQEKFRCIEVTLPENLEKILKIPQEKAPFHGRAPPCTEQRSLFAIAGEEQLKAFSCSPDTLSTLGL